MKKVKRIFCAILCIAVIFSIFAISAYAVNQTFWAARGSEGYIKESHSVYIVGANGKNYGYIFPKYSILRLQRDLYTTDSTAFGILTDPFSEDHYSMSQVEVPIYKVYMATATDSLPPDIS